jgi:hypothetical protein
MLDFDPSRPAILHDRLQDVIIAWSGEHVPGSVSASSAALRACPAPTVLARRFLSWPPIHPERSGAVRNGIVVGIDLGLQRERVPAGVEQSEVQREMRARRPLP